MKTTTCKKCGAVNNAKASKHVAFTAKRARGAHHARLAAATRRDSRAQWWPLRLHQKERALALAVLPMGHYGALSAQLPKQQRTKFRAAIGRSSNERQSQVLLPHPGSSS